MLIFEEGTVIESPSAPFARTEGTQLAVDCALQGYFYCHECEAYTYHGLLDETPRTDDNTCDVCQYRGGVF